MGFFSWRTADTLETIWNKSSFKGAYPIKIFWLDGTVSNCHFYEGYGAFEGIDIQAHIAFHHEFCAPSATESQAIAAFYVKSNEVCENLGVPFQSFTPFEAAGYQTPRLVSLDFDGDPWDLPPNVDDMDQGFFPPLDGTFATQLPNLGLDLGSLSFVNVAIPKTDRTPTGFFFQDKAHFLEKKEFFNEKAGYEEGYTTISIPKTCFRFLEMGTLLRDGRNKGELDNLCAHIERKIKIELTRNPQ